MLKFDRAMENASESKPVNSRFDHLLKTGVVETKLGNIQVFDPEFWKNPAVWKAPDGTYVPTLSVITTAMYLGTVLGTGISSSMAMFESASKFIEQTQGHAKAADLIMGMNKSIIESRRSIALCISGLFTGVEFVNIKAALKFRDMSKDEYSNKISAILESDLELDNDTKGILKANWVRNYLNLCLTDLRRRKSSQKIK